MSRGASAGIDRRDADLARVAGAFRRTVYAHYQTERRDLPWRRTTDPYAILVSELMLQQTQVERVLHHYQPFLDAFPTTARLAAAPLAEVLSSWSGLGYNRRAVALQRAADLVERDHGGRIPRDRDDLLRLPGVGPATSGAVLAFAFGVPVVFVETNIRRACLAELTARSLLPAAAEDQPIRDALLVPLLERALDRDDPRNWYYALMDYGAALGRAARRRGAAANPNLASADYRRQSRFAGSARQLRGAIVRALVESGAAATAGELWRVCRGVAPATTRARAARVIDQLHDEGLLERVPHSRPLLYQLPRDRQLRRMIQL